MPSIEEAETGDSEVDSFITQAEVTEVVQKLLSGKEPGVDEIRPEYLKSLDVVGLSCLIRLCSIAWQLGTVPLDWQTGGGPCIQKGGSEGVFQLSGGSHASASLGKYSWGTGEGNLADSRTLDPGGTMQFSSWPWNTGPALYPPQGARGFMGVCPTSPHVFCGLGEGIRPCPFGILWEVLWEYGVGGPLPRAVQSRSLVRIAGNKSDLFLVHVGVRQGCPLSPVLFIIFMERISRSSKGPEGVWFGSHWISSCR